MNNKQLINTSRKAGFLFFLWIVTGFYDMLFVSPRIIVAGDAAMTAQNILQQELLFRSGIFSGLVTSAVWILLVWVFHRLFKSVNEQYAKLLVAFVIVQVPVAFMKGSLSMAALMTLKGDVLKSFEWSQRLDLAMLFLKMNDYAVWALELFWGLWLFPLAVLVYQSKFIPRVLGIWLFFTCFVYILLCFVSIVFPSYKSAVFTYGMPAMFGELVLMLWLLIKGARSRKVIS
jgi:hypothetical protein